MTRTPTTVIEITEKTMAIILDIELCSSSMYLIEAIATAVIGKAYAHHATENLSNRKQNIQKRNKNTAPGED
jgi:hypothetical protein